MSLVHKLIYHHNFSKLIIIHVHVIIIHQLISYNKRKKIAENILAII